MAGISSQAANTLENNKKYNGIELENDLEIQTYDAFFRELDPQTARWWQVDPKTENMEMWSPYAANYDNPIRYSDPLGDEGQECCWEKIKAFFTINQSLNQAMSVKMGEVVKSTLKTMATNAKANWEAENTIVHDVMAQPISIIDGTAEAKLVGRALGLEVKIGKEAAKEGQFIIQKSEKWLAAEKKLSEAAAGKKGAGGTDFVVNNKGEAVVIPDGATGPSNPNKGTGMSYHGGSGGKGMDKKTSGVRIMDANSNQGRRINYMNKSGQTVDPKTGQTISNKDPRGHLPYGN